MLLRVPDLPRPSVASVDRAAIELARVLGDSRVIRGEGCAPYASDESEVLGPGADIVVLADDLECVRSTLEIAARNDVPVTPRAGGTGRTGGAVPAAGGIVLATDKLSRVKEIDRKNLIAVVEPGVVLGAFHDLVEAEGLFYPPDPNSLASCCLGGNVAENAGGPRAFRYGVTREYVLGLETVLMGGTVVRSGKRTVKGVAGYDVTALLVGSEGTLGVFSEITLRLVRKPEGVSTLLAIYTDAASAARSVEKMIAEGIVPRCMELMDARTLEAIRSQKVEVDPRAGALLLMELDGTERHREESLERVAEAIGSAEGVIDIVVAKDESQRAHLWSARRALSPATRKLAKHKLSEDVVVPRASLTTLLERVEAIGEKTKIKHLTYGHAGDGNMHVNFLWNDDEERPRVDDAIEMLMRDTVALGGTISGEHGIGITKLPYLPIEQSPELIALQRNIKSAFDPKGLLNPGKIFQQAGHKLC